MAPFGGFKLGKKVEQAVLDLHFTLLIVGARPAERVGHVGIAVFARVLLEPEGLGLGGRIGV
jgi:hypothetical protein